MKREHEIDDSAIVSHKNWMDKPHKKLLEPCPNCGGKVEAEDVPLYSPAENRGKEERRWRCSITGELLAIGSHTFKLGEDE